MENVQGRELLKIFCKFLNQIQYHNTYGNNLRDLEVLTPFLNTNSYLNNHSLSHMYISYVQSCLSDWLNCNPLLDSRNMEFHGLL